MVFPNPIPFAKFPFKSSSISNGIARLTPVERENSPPVRSRPGKMLVVNPVACASAETLNLFKLRVPFNSARLLSSLWLKKFIKSGCILIPNVTDKSNATLKLASSNKPCTFADSSFAPNMALAGPNRSNILAKASAKSSLPNTSSMCISKSIANAFRAMK